MMKKNNEKQLARKINDIKEVVNETNSAIFDANVKITFVKTLFDDLIEKLNLDLVYPQENGTRNFFENHEEMATYCAMITGYLFEAQELLEGVGA